MLIESLLLGAIWLTSPVFGNVPECSVDLVATGQCPAVVNSGTQIDVGASMNIPGSRGENSNPGTSNPRDGDAAPDSGASEAENEDCGLCRPNYSVGILEEDDLPAVTIDDLASFVPARPTLTGEPAGFAVVGMPANLVAAASEQQIAGELFDWDVVVRFTPVAFIFDHGDGTTASASTGGATWTDLGQAQFTPTATSHVYGERGTYSVNVTVQYAAAVDFGIGWQVIPGHVTATAGGYDVQVLEARTALVAKTCLENPDGPGC